MLLLSMLLLVPAAAATATLQQPQPPTAVQGLLTAPPPTEDPDACVDPGDTAWVALSTVLVLTMMPSLALFEAGLLRTRSTVSILTQVGGWTDAWLGNWGGSWVGVWAPILDELCRQLIEGVA